MYICLIKLVSNLMYRLTQTSKILNFYIHRNGFDSISDLDFG